MKRNHKLLNKQNGIAGLICIALLFVISYDLGMTGNPANLTGKYGFPRNTEVFFANDQIEPDQLDELLALNRITVMAVHQDSGLIYDPENYFLGNSFYSTLNGQNFYFSESDYRQKADKTIQIASDTSGERIDLMEFENEELGKSGISQLENLMKTGIPKGSEVYLFSSSTMQPEPDELQVETASRIFDRLSMSQMPYQITVPSLWTILSDAISHPYTRMVSAAGLAFAGFMMYMLLMVTRRSNISWRTLFPKFILLGICGGILNLILLCVQGYTEVLIPYALDTTLFIWLCSAVSWLILAPLVNWLFTYTINKREKAMSMVSGLAFGVVVATDSVLVSALVNSLAAGYGPDTMFILCCLILPLTVSYILVYHSLFGSVEERSFQDTGRILNTAGSLILIVLAALIGTGFIPWTAALIAVLLLIPVFRLDVRKQPVRP